MLFSFWAQAQGPFNSYSRPTLAQQWSDIRPTRTRPAQQQQACHQAQITQQPSLHGQLLFPFSHAWPVYMKPPRTVTSYSIPSACSFSRYAMSLLPSLVPAKNLPHVRWSVRVEPQLQLSMKAPTSIFLPHA